MRPGGNATSTSGNATATAQHGELVSDDIVGRWKALPVFSEDAATAAAAAAAVAAGAEAGDSKEKMGTFDFAPPMTVQKYKTMQERRVLVVIKCELCHDAEERDSDRMPPCSTKISRFRPRSINNTVYSTLRTRL